jgi:hypothetical protein
VTGLSDTAVYAVGAGGTILRYDGTSWSQVWAGTFENLSTVVNSGKQVFAVGSNGTILVVTGATPAVPVFTVPAGETVRAIASIASDATLLYFLFQNAGVYFVRLDRPGSRCAGPEINCRNGWDDDCDGLVDGADPDCAGDATPEQCANDHDDDFDGAIDCSDPDCAANTMCSHGGQCQSATPLACGASVNGTNTGAASRRDRWFCDSSAEPGPEVFYTVSRSTDGPINLSLSGFAPADLALIAIGTAGTSACDPMAACLGAASTSNDPEVLSIAAIAGTTYYVAVDGKSTTASYALSVGCP